MYANKKMYDFFSEWIEKFARGITLSIVNAHRRCLFVSRIRPSQQFFSYSALLNDTTWWVLVLKRRPTQNGGDRSLPPESDTTSSYCAPISVGTVMT